MSQFSMAADSVISEISRFQPGEPVGNIRLNPTNDDYVKDKIAHIFTEAVSMFSFDINPQIVRGFVDDFFVYYETSIPELMKGQPGSTSLPGLLPLYLVSRTIAPDMIIESGVFIGSSLHMYSDTFSDLPIYAFDINLKKLKFEPDNVVLNEMDWSQFENLPRYDNTFVFFDDHINCAKRIIECQSRGVRWAVFDDSPPIGRLAHYRYPAIPSIPMIMDELLAQDCSFEWLHKPTNTKLKYTHDLDLCQNARKAIRKAVSLDVFSEVTGASCGDKWLVEIACE